MERDTMQARASVRGRRSKSPHYVRYCGLDNFDIANAIDFEMPAKIIGVGTTGFEGNGPATLADQCENSKWAP